MDVIKAKYENRIIGTDTELVVSFSNEETGLLSLLFNGEFDCFYDWIYETINDSLEDSVDREIAGNICKLAISKDYTLINDLTSDEDYFLKIDTLFLKELMCEWKEKHEGNSL